MASQTTEKPLLVIIPGALADVSMYDSVIDHLHTLGQPTVAFPLKTSFTTSPVHHAPTVQEDVAYFNGILQGLLSSEKDRDIIVLGHSYGGMVLTESVQGLVGKDTVWKGKGRVKGLIYYTAAVPDVGETMGELLAGGEEQKQKDDAEAIDLNFMKVEGNAMSIENFELCAKVNFSDLPLEEGIEQSKKFLSQSVMSFQNKCEYAGWKDAPTSYIYVSEDKTLPPAFQKRMIEKLKGTGNAVNVYTMKAGHCGPISQPKELADIILKAVEQLA